MRQWSETNVVSHTNWWATKKLQENKELAADKHANLRVRDLSMGLGAMQTDDWMCTGRGTGRKKVGINTWVWKRLVTSKTDGQCAYLTSSPQSVLSSCKISSWLSLCNPLCCVGMGGWVLQAPSASCCQDQCEWMWDQELESGQRCRLWSGLGGRDRRGCVNTPGIHWCAGLCESRVCWVCLSVLRFSLYQGRGVVCLYKYSHQSFKSVMLNAAPCLWQPVSPSYVCLCASFLVSSTE